MRYARRGGWIALAVTLALGAALAVGIGSALKPVEATPVDGPWRAEQLALTRQALSRPRDAFDAASTAFESARRQGDAVGAMRAAQHGATASRWLNDAHRRVAAQHVNLALADGGVKPGADSVRFDLLLAQGLGLVDSGTPELADAPFKAAERLAAHLPDSGRTAELELARAQQDIALGSASDATPRLERALPAARDDFSRASILLWTSVVTRRNSFFSPVAQQRAFAQIHGANAFVDARAYPAFGIVARSLQAQAAVVLENNAESMLDAALMTDLAAGLAQTQGVTFVDLAPIRILRQFRQSDLDLARALQRRRTLLAWGLAGIGLVVGIAAAAVTLQWRHRRRLRTMSTQLERQNAELHELMRRRTELLAMASHKLRQPAHGLCLTAELAELACTEHPDRVDSDVLDRQLERIRRFSTAMGEMLSDLMDMNRLDGGHYEPTVRTFALQGLLDEARQHFAPDAERKGLRLLVPESDVHVVSDYRLLRRIVFNLVSNAVAYSTRGIVSVTVRRHDGLALLSIEDNGPGLAVDRMHDVFGDYARLGGEKAPEGLGIGLLVVKRASDRLGHAVHVESKPGHGTRVELSLPVAEHPLQAAPEPTAAPVTGDTRAPLIGILENDSDTRLAMAELLRQWGYRVVAGDTTAELQQAAKASGDPLDMLVTDLHLTGANGLEEAATIRTWPEQERLPVLVVTGDLQADIALQAVKADMLIAHKPLRPALLRSYLQEVLAPP